MQKESSDDPDQFRPCRPITIATRASLVGVITALLLTGLALNLLVPSLTGLIPADELSRRWPWKALTTVVDGLILATLVAITPAIGWRQARFFWANIAAYLGIYYAIRLGIPPLSMQISGKESWLPVPGALMVMYLVPVLTAMGIYITSSDRTMKEFFLPLRVLFAGAGAATIGALVLIPLRVGLAAYETLAPRTVSPTTARTQHPSQYPSRYRGLVNPFRNPSAAAVQRFLVRVKEDAAGPLGPISSVHDPLIDQLREQIAGGSSPDGDLARRALIAYHAAEGRALYQKNCRPCHGTKASGAGPMARGFRPRPINFRELGTIEILPEESYLLWRMEEGGIGLPAVSTPWDSAMPAWKHDFDPSNPEMRELLWKISLAEFDTADKSPRRLEGAGGEPAPSTRKSHTEGE